MTYEDYDWIEDGLAVGAMVEEGKDLPFDAVLSLVPFAPVGLCDVLASGEVEYQWHSIQDQRSGETDEEIVRRFDAAADRIDEWRRENKRVLVHCQVGASRSVTAIIWYLVRYRGMTWEQAAETVRARRPIARPTIWFEVPLRLAAGERLDRAWLEERMSAYARHMAEATGAEFTREDMLDGLEAQGSLAQLDGS